MKQRRVLVVEGAETDPLLGLGGQYTPIQASVIREETDVKSMLALTTDTANCRTEDGRWLNYLKQQGSLASTTSKLPPISHVATVCNLLRTACTVCLSLVCCNCMSCMHMHAVSAMLCTVYVTCTYVCLCGLLSVYRFIFASCCTVYYVCHDWLSCCVILPLFPVLLYFGKVRCVVMFDVVLYQLAEEVEAIMKGDEEVVLGVHRVELAGLTWVSPYI